MNRFAGIVQKEVRHILRDRRTLLILIGMPIIQILLFGFAISNEIRQASIAIYNRSQSTFSHDLVNALVSSDRFRMSAEVHRYEEVHDMFRRGKARVAVVIAADAERALERGESAVQIITDASDPNTASTLAAWAESIVRSTAAARLRRPPAAAVAVQTRMLFNPEVRSEPLFIPGLMSVLLMLVSAMMTSISIAREKELGTMEVLLTSPINPFLIVMGKVIPYLALGAFNASAIVALGYTVFNVTVQGSLLLLCAEIMLFLLTTLSLGIMISSVSNSQQTAMMISLMGLMLPTIILSGFIFPIENMPLPLRVVSSILPARWFNDIARGIMLKSMNFEMLWQQTAILFGMTCVYIAVGIKRFKLRLE